MAQGRVTKRAVDALQCRAGKDRIFLWDDALAGFGVAAFPTGRKVYVAQYRKDGRSRRITIGEHGRFFGRCGLRPGTRFRRAFAGADRPDAPSASLRSFFIGLDDLAVLRGMARSGADVGEAVFLEERYHITLVKIDAECLSDDALEVYASPAHDAVRSRSGPASTIWRMWPTAPPTGAISDHPSNCRRGLPGQRR